MVVVDEVWVPLARVAAEESVEALETSPSGQRSYGPAAVSWLLGVRCHLPTMNVLYPWPSSISDRNPFSNGMIPL